MTPTDQKLIEEFEHHSIPLSRWDQRTHVSIAYLYLSEHGFDAALEKIRTGIRAFNAHNDIEDSPTSGYNETTTVALLRLIDTTMKTYGDLFPTTSADQFCDTHPQLMSKHALRFFYSPPAACTQTRRRPSSNQTWHRCLCHLNREP